MIMTDRNGNKIEQGECFFYEDNTHDKLWLCQLDGRLVRCTDLDNHDKVNNFYADEFHSNRAYLA